MYFLAQGVGVMGVLLKVNNILPGWTNVVQEVNYIKNFELISFLCILRKSGL